MYCAGDHLLTASAVAKHTGITPKKNTAHLVQCSGHWEWRSGDAGDSAHLREDFKSVKVESFTKAQAQELSGLYDLCIGGDGITYLQERGLLQLWAPLVKVFARTSPKQKEDIVNALGSSGMTTLMCGDGTNDVGALKAAGVGVALVDVQALHSAAQQELEQQQANAARPGKRGMLEELQQQQQEADRATQASGEAVDT